MVSNEGDVLNSGICGPTNILRLESAPRTASGPLSTPQLCADMFELNIKGKCYPYDSKEVIDYLMKRYKRKPKLNPERLYGFIQGRSTCWFNATMMALFANTSGVEYFNYYRKYMITGEDVDGNKLDTNIHKALWLLNISLDGIYRESHIALGPDKIIELTRLVKNHAKRFTNKPYVAGSPIELIEDLFANIDFSKLRIINIRSISFYLKDTKIPEDVNIVTEYLTKSKLVPQYNVLYFQVGNEHITNGNKHIPLEFTNRGKVYRMDSCLLFNLATKDKKGHVIAGLRINNEFYVYDGEMAKVSRTVIKLDWTKTLRGEYMSIPGVKEGDGNKYGYYVVPFYFRVR